MKYAKAIAAAVGEILTVTNDVLQDNVLDTSDLARLISTIVLQAATVYAVFRVPNKSIGLQD